jgi:hypothetical protein
MTKDKDKHPHLTVVSNTGGKLTSKQEHFAHLVAKGSMLTDAYREAGYMPNGSEKTKWEAACRLAASSKVKARIDQIVEEDTARRQTDDDRLRNWVTDQLKREAVEAGSDSARVAALTQLGRSVGMFTDRVEQEDKTPRTAHDIEADIQRKLALIMGE